MHKSSQLKTKIPVILGATAVGKTELAVALAQKFGYEILSCDSRQIYRHMDIGTAKPSQDQLSRAHHWLVDKINPDQLYSAFNFAQDSLEIFRSQHQPGKKILICGGSGLYFHTLCSGTVAAEEADMEIRALLQRRALEGGEDLHRELSGVDPETASRLHPNDLQRIIRALGVYYQTGRPLSSQQSSGNPPEDLEFEIMILDRSRDELYRRIEIRVDEMVATGLVEEFQKLRNMGYGEKSPGMVCVGYRELFAVESGESSFKDAVEKIKQNTRRYAKRQMTWFRNKSTGKHIDMSEGYQKVFSSLCSILEQDCAC